MNYVHLNKTIHKTKKQTLTQSLKGKMELDSPSTLEIASEIDI